MSVLVLITYFPWQALGCSANSNSHWTTHLINKEFVLNITTKLSLLAFASSNLIFASLLPLGYKVIPATGNGNVNTALIFSSPGATSNESGCVGYALNAPGGGTVTGSSVCPAGFTGNNEQTGQNQTYTASSLGLVNFSNLQLVFNVVEPNSAAQQSITIDAIAITLWNPNTTTPTLIQSFSTIAPYVIANPLGTGGGNSGYAFALDAVQAAQANARLLQTPNLRIGVASNASNATGGPERIFFRVVPSDENGGGGVAEVPEPTSYALVGLGLLSAAFFNSRKKS